MAVIAAWHVHVRSPEAHVASRHGPSQEPLKPKSRILHSQTLLVVLGAYYIHTLLMPKHLNPEPRTVVEAL